MFPVRCYTCNAVLAHLYPLQDTLDAVGAHRLCCRRMFLGYVDLTTDQMRQPNVDTPLDDGGTVLLRRAVAPRTVSCD